MRKMPLALFLFSLMMVGIAMSMPLQLIYLEGYHNMFRSFTALNIIIIFLCLANALAAYHVHKSIRLLIPLTLICVLINNWWVGYVGFNYSSNETTLASFSFLAICAALLEKNTFRVLANPKLKWWHVPIRSQVEVPVSLLLSSRSKSPIKRTFDISETGFFLKDFNESELEKIKIGDKLSVCFHYDDILKVRCNAKIIRKTAKVGHYPSGIGLKFDNIDEHTKLAIKMICQSANQMQT